MSTPVNAVTEQFFKDLFERGFMPETLDEESYGSDHLQQIISRGIASFSIRRRLNTDDNTSGQFFPFVNTSDIDLSNLQIFTQNQINDKGIQDQQEHCLIHALGASDIPDCKLSEVKFAIQEGAHVSKSSLKKISEIIERKIVLHRYVEVKNTLCLRKESHGRGEEVNIALFLGHYFAVVETEWSKSAIKLYSKVKDLENRKNVSKLRDDGRVRYDETSPRATSLFMVKALHDQGIFVKGNMVHLPEASHHAQIKKHINLGEVLEEQNPHIQKQKEQRSYPGEVVFIDKEQENETNYNYNYENGEQVPTEDLPHYKLEQDALFDKGIQDIKEDYEKGREYRKELRATEPEQRHDPVFYVDTETFTNGAHHELFLLGAVSHDKHREEDVKIWQVNEGRSAQQVVTAWLQWMVKERSLKDLTKKPENLTTQQAKEWKEEEKRKVIAYFHNAKYDLSVLRKYLPLTGRPVKKDGAIYSVTTYVNKRQVEIRCSLKVVPMPLRKFAGTFGLPEHLRKKEAIAYRYYTLENSSYVSVKASIYRDFLPDSDKSKFDEIIQTVPSYDGEYFDPIAYYRHYLKYDCLVLRAGFIKFSEAIEDVTFGMISVYDCLSISSITDKFAIKCGAYRGVFQVKGNLREYIGQAVYGGRVHVNEKYKKKLLTGRPIADYDGVSLYPSAIFRLCSETGFPMGPARRFEPETLNTWRDKDYAVLTVRVKEVRKNQQMPFIAHRGDGVIDYLNKAPSEPIIIDKTTLEDYIEFHDVTYEVLDGVYWNCGFNKRMGEVVETLFNERLVAKAAKNEALQNTLKLMLNSAYGKTVLKKSKVEFSYIKKTTKDKNGNDINNLENHINKHFHLIKSIRPINDNLVEVEKISVDQSCNRAHIGCSILSMSKRIMNEVMGTANDNDIPIFYQDTDSMHMYDDEVEKLKQVYGDKYGRELDGPKLGQFHVDFDLHGAKGKIVATTSIFLGKKAYIDKLESTDKEGNPVIGHHIRLKGVNNAAIREAKNEFGCALEFYKHLAEGKEYLATLNPSVDDCMMEHTVTGVRTRQTGKFKRLLRF